MVGRTVIGVIADDVTGGTDVAVAFRRAGLATVILFGQPDDQTILPYHDAVVIALKTRTLPVDEAVAESLGAAAWLKNHGAGQLYFKCRTAVLQVLLHLRFQTRRKHRPGCRRPGRPPGSTPDRRRPGFAGTSPHPVHGQPVHRRPAASGITEEPPPADPDDRLEHRPAADGPDRPSR